MLQDPVLDKNTAIRFPYSDVEDLLLYWNVKNVTSIEASPQLFLANYIYNVQNPARHCLAGSR